MKRFSLTDHTADVRLLLEGSTLEELFEAGLSGMNHIMKKNMCDEKTGYEFVYEMKINSPDTTSLLIDFLSEVLTLSHINKAVYCRAVFSMLSEKSLECNVFGKAVEEFDEDVKAVSYHEAEVKNNETGNFITNIIFDI